MNAAASARKAACSGESFQSMGSDLLICVCDSGGLSASRRKVVNETGSSGEAEEWATATIR